MKTKNISFIFLRVISKEQWQQGWICATFPLQWRKWQHSSASGTSFNSDKNKFDYFRINSNQALMQSEERIYYEILSLLIRILLTPCTMNIHLYWAVLKKWYYKCAEFKVYCDHNTSVLNAVTYLIMIHLN